jgi:L,D-peptidoglycan transpeptidase YkuD (ErfK/YbiS/YcfS/YnhG family)
MIILLKNKHTVQFNEFNFRCCIGKNGLTKFKKEGDCRTPKGTFKLEHLYYRKDKIDKPKTKLKCVVIKSNMGWCDDIKNKNYNKLVKVNKSFSHEKLFRKDKKYDLMIPIKYNFNKIIRGKGSCIFLHLTQNYKPTAGCIALKKKDFLILLKLINKNTKIKIF